MCLWRELIADEGMESPQAWIMSGYESPDVGTGNWTQVVYMIGHL